MTDRTAPDALVLVQELANTLDIEDGEDALATPRGLADFGARHGLVLAPRERGAVCALREALRAACLAHTGTPVPPAEAAALRGLLERAPLVLAVDGQGGAALRPAPGLTGARALAARVAAGIATGAVDGSWRRLKACEAHDCRWVFYDRSPAGRGRWCTMAVCGSRAKMRSYRARRRA